MYVVFLNQSCLSLRLGMFTSVNGVVFLPGVLVFLLAELSLSPFNDHFPGGPGLAGTRMSPFWIYWG